MARPSPREEAVTEERLDEEVDPEFVREAAVRHGRALGAVIAVLEEIQSRYGYLPGEALRIVSECTGRSLVDLYAMATFYQSFSLTPKGRHRVSVCLGTACHVRGSGAVVEAFERQLGVKAGGTTADRQFTLETLNCLGACALGPVVVADGRYVSKVRRPMVRQILEGALAGFDGGDLRTDPRVFPIAVSCPRCGTGLMDRGFELDGVPSIRLDVSVGDRRGWLRLSSLYGSHALAAEHDIPAGVAVEFHCPHCRERMADSWGCPACGAATVPMAVDGGGTVQVCSRRGCRYHMLDIG